MPSFRDEHILVISPGSQVTLAQLGLPESFTPPKLRISSRMFHALEEGAWTWTKIREAREGEKDRLLAAAMVEEDDEEDEDESEDDDEEDGEEEGDDEEGDGGDNEEDDDDEGEDDNGDEGEEDDDEEGDDDEEDDGGEDSEEVEEGGDDTPGGTEPEGDDSKKPNAPEPISVEGVTEEMGGAIQRATSPGKGDPGAVSGEAKSANPELGAEDSEMVDVTGEPGEDAGEGEEEDTDEEEDGDDEGEDEEEGEDGEEGEGEELEEGDEVEEGEDEDEEDDEDEDEDEDEEEEEEEGDDDQDEEMDDVFVEDEDDEEGAVWCMKEGKIVDWGCFFALLQHVHETINPTFHTPILMLCPPSFTPSDKEMITQFVFEKLKAPGFVLMDMALAALWAYGLSTATVIDVGYEKTDITPVLEFSVQERARETVSGWGGESLTKHLVKLLPDLNYEEVEQLKRSPICEILHSGNLIPNAKSVNTAIAAGNEKGKRPATDLDGSDLIDEEEGTMNVAAIVASGKTHEFLAKREKEKRGEAERKLPNRERETNSFWVVEKKEPGDELAEPLKMAIDEPQSAVSVSAPKLPEVVVGAEAPPAIPVATAVIEGPATIVVPGLEAVSTDIAPAPPTTTIDEAAALPNAAAPAQLETAEATTVATAIEISATELSVKEPMKPVETATTVVATEISVIDGDPTTSTTEVTTVTGAPLATVSASATEADPAPAPPPAPAPVLAPAAPPPPPPAPAPSAATDEEGIRKQKEKERRKEEKRAAAEGLPSIGEDEIRREIQVGVERFMAAECGILQELADCVWRSISKVEDVSRRAELWESLILVGNGSKVKGFKEALLQTIQNKYIIPPSSATIFSSELPSNISTPAATGTSTPVPQSSSTHAGANPLLVAATTSNLPLPNMGHHGHHSSHGQTPTTIKFPKAPEYFPEWKDAGFEEAAFLGAQIAAKVLFIVDQGANGGFMTRVEYNEGGPAAIHSV